MKFQQSRFDLNGKQTDTDRIIEIDIYPGAKRGSKIVFQNVRDLESGGWVDLHFVLEEASFQFKSSPS